MGLRALRAPAPRELWTVGASDNNVTCSTVDLAFPLPGTYYILVGGAAPGPPPGAGPWSVLLTWAFSYGPLPPWVDPAFPAPLPSLVRRARER